MESLDILTTKKRLTKQDKELIRRDLISLKTMVENNVDIKKFKEKIKCSSPRARYNMYSRWIWTA